MASGLLRPREIFVAPRFAMWLLGSPPLDASHNVSDLLAEDQQLLRQLGAPLRPAGRLLLPLAAAPSPDQLSSLRLWADADDGDVHECWLRAMQQQQRGGFVALTVFKQPEAPVRPVSNIPGRVGSRLLLSNQHVNLWDFHVTSGTCCDLHEHLHPYVFFNRTACATRGLNATLQPSGPVTAFAACEFRCVEVNEHERHVHAFQNPGQADVQQYIVEFNIG